MCLAEEKPHGLSLDEKQAWNGNLRLPRDGGEGSSAVCVFVCVCVYVCVCFQWFLFDDRSPLL